MSASMKFVVPTYFGIILTLLATLIVSPLRKEIKGPLSKFVFYLIVESGLVFNSYFIWKQLSRTFDYIFAQWKIDRFRDRSTDSKNGTIFNKLSRLILLVLIFAAQFSFVTNIFLISQEPTWVAHLCYASLGLLGQLGCWLVVIKGLVWVLQQSKVLSKSNKKSHCIQTIIACIYAIGLSVHGLHAASKLPSVKQVEIPIRNLDTHFHNFKIVQVSDIHLGPTVGRQRLGDIVDIVNSLKPDAVVIVGDLIDGTVAKLKTAIEPIKHIKSKYGIYFVSGNHEYLTNDVDNWYRYLAEMGINVLHNSNEKIISHSDPSQYFYIAGTDDVMADKIRYDGHGFHLDKAVQSCDITKPIILLAHQPIAAKMALDSNYENIELVLSGHTHGGQMFPMNIGAWLVNPFFLGLYQYNSRYVYVSEGTVFWGIPMRIFTSMEITEIYLKP